MYYNTTDLQTKSITSLNLYIPYIYIHDNANSVLSYQGQNAQNLYIIL